MTTDENTFMERIEKLEGELTKTKQRSRGFFIALTLAVVVLGAVSTLFFAGYCTIRGTAFTLVDNQRHERGKLEMTEDGPQLTLQDENGKRSAWLHTDDEGPRLSLLDHNGKLSAQLCASTFYGPGLLLTDENSKACAMLGVFKDVQCLILSGENGEVRAKMGADKDRTSLVLQGEYGKPIWSAP